MSWGFRWVLRIDFEFDMLIVINGWLLMSDVTASANLGCTSRVAHAVKGCTYIVGLDRDYLPLLRRLVRNGRAAIAMLYCNCKLNFAKDCVASDFHYWGRFTVSVSSQLMLDLRRCRNHYLVNNGIITYLTFLRFLFPTIILCVYIII